MPHPVPPVLRWRIAYAATIALLLCATSSLPALPAVSFYPRYVALASLAFITQDSHRHLPATPVTDLSRSARYLAHGMTLATVAAFCSALWSVDPIVTLQQAIALCCLAATVNGLIRRRWPQYPALVRGDIATAYWVVTVWLSAGLAAWVAGVQGTESASGFADGEASGIRYQGLVSNPNMLAVVAIPAIPIGWYLYQQRGQYRYLITTLPAVASVLMSQSRTAIIAVAAGALFMMLRRGAAAGVRVAVGVAVGLTMAWLAGFTSWLTASPLLTEIQDRFASQAGGGALNGRSQAWSETVQLILQRPLTGYGYGAGPALFELLRSRSQLLFGRDVAHNSYLQWMLETGLVGLPAVIALTVACAVAAYTVSRERYASGLGWCVVAGLLLQATESTMLGTGQVYPAVFWVFVAAASVQTRGAICSPPQAKVTRGAPAQ